MSGNTLVGVALYRLSVGDGSLGGVTEIDAKIDALVPEWLTLPDIAERFGVEVTRVRQQVKEGLMIAVRRGENRALHVPADFIAEDRIVKGLTGTLTLLRDDGFSDEGDAVFPTSEFPAAAGIVNAVSKPRPRRRRK